MEMIGDVFSDPADLKTVCDVCVTSFADYIGSPSGIVNYAIRSDRKEFIIGTEISIQEHLQYQFPDKRFYYLTQKLICPNMKSTTLVDLYNCVAGNGGEEILLDSNAITKSRRCIDISIFPPNDTFVCNYYSYP